MTAAVLNETTTLRSLAALAQAQRLRAFRALVVAGPAGLTAGTIAPNWAWPPARCRST